MEGKDMEGQLRRSSLGRVAFIGELYDARTESFSSRSLLKSTLPSHLIGRRNIGKTEFDYRFTNSVSDRFNLLKVQPELQLSVLLGFVSVSGSGTFLTEAERSEKSVSCSVVCSMSTVCEKFFAPFAEIIDHIDLGALEDEENTHLVTEINWGANCLLNMVATAASECDKEELKGELSGRMEMLKSILSVGGKGALEKKQSDRECLRDVHIKVWADIVPDGAWPTSAESFCDFVKDVPRLLKKENEGKGKPLNYVMISLNTFRRLAKLSSAAETVVRFIDESFLMSTVYLLEDIALVRRKLHDLIAEMSDMRKYLGEEALQVGRKHQQDLAVKDSQLKLIISKQWVHVKSGKKDLIELIRNVEDFKNRSLRLYVYEEYLESTAAIHEKVAMVNKCISHGIVYLGQGDTFDSVLSQSPLSEFLVLLMSSRTKEENSELHISTLLYFLTEASDPRPNTRYVMVDLDLQREQTFMNVCISTSIIFHLKGGKILSRDKFAEYKADITSNFVRRKTEAQVVHMTHKPGNRVPLEMICPGFQMGTCSTDELSWECFRCKNSIEYGFDGFFYCSCGGSQVADMEYRCSHPSHGNLFIEGSKDFIRTKLSSLKPLKEMNVLVIGCSGVGKSTWINSIVNYLSFETLEKAMEHGVICTIPARFVMYDAKTLKKHVIDVGVKSSREVNDTGHSATQYTHTYSFIWEGKCVRLIDTPGLGDTRGIEQDKINLSNIIHHLGYLKELHGVCILMKANDNRLNAIFSYCLKELLVHLHKSVAKNILFCFTNARNSLYTPGQTSAILEKLIRQLGVERDLPLGRHNMFCLDNEAFIFLCSLTIPEITHDAKLLESFGHSWKISLDETRRLFETVRSFEPHDLNETLSLVNIRNRITSLAKPVADIGRSIQINVDTMIRNQREIETSDQTLQEYSKRLQWVEVHLEPTPLDYPITVCTSPSCVEYISFENVGVQEIEYKTHCHEECGLENVESLTVNNAALRNCQAMNNSGKCEHCGCRWEKHMHIRYKQNRVYKTVLNEKVQNEMMQEKSEKEKAESVVKELEVLIEKYKKEQNFIIQTSIKFGMFLRRNSITVYNDSVADYMQYLIEEEENKPHKSESERNLLQRMKDMLAQYQAEVVILTEVIKKGEKNNEELKVEQMLELEQQLYGLELTGEEIRKCVECNRFTKQKMCQYAETPVRIPPKPKVHDKSNKITGLKSWMGQQKNAVIEMTSKLVRLN